MKIAVGKIGSRVIFDRDSAEAKRPNSNGNVGAYNLFRLLFDNNKHDTFFFIGDSDLPVGRSERWSNVINIYPAVAESANVVHTFDSGLFIAGIDDSSKCCIGRFIQKHLGSNYVLIADDPRCLAFVAGSMKIAPPKVILSQSDKIMRWNTGSDIINVFTKYAPIELADAYLVPIVDPDESKRDRTMSVVANSSNGTMYDRIGILIRLFRRAGAHAESVNFYGKLLDGDGDRIHRIKCKYLGAVDYDAVQMALRNSLSTFIVPIEPGIVTSKYVEALCNGCLPVFWHEYGIQYIAEMRALPIVHDADGLKRMLSYVSINAKDAKRWVRDLQDRLIKPFVDGVVISSIVMKALRY